MNVNLIEREENKEDKLKIIIILFLVMIFIFSGYLYYKYSELQNLNSKIKILEQENERYSVYKNKYLNIKRKISSLENNKEKIRWEAGIKELGYIVPEGILFEELQLKDRNTLYIKGRAKDRKALKEFSANINNSTYYNTFHLQETIEDSYIFFEIEIILMEKE